ncbi:unnamed protein product [Chrysoparadoxa australica]
MPSAQEEWSTDVVEGIKALQSDRGKYEERNKSKDLGVSKLERQLAGVAASLKDVQWQTSEAESVLTLSNESRYLKLLQTQQLDSLCKSQKAQVMQHVNELADGIPHLVEMLQLRKELWGQRGDSGYKTRPPALILMQVLKSMYKQTQDCENTVNELSNELESLKKDVKGSSGHVGSARGSNASRETTRPSPKGYHQLRHQMASVMQEELGKFDPPRRLVEGPVFASYVSPSPASQAAPASSRPQLVVKERLSSSASGTHHVTVASVVEAETKALEVASAHDTSAQATARKSRIDPTAQVRTPEPSVAAAVAKAPVDKGKRGVADGQASTEASFTEPAEVPQVSKETPPFQFSLQGSKKDSKEEADKGATPPAAEAGKIAFGRQESTPPFSFAVSSPASKPADKAVADSKPGESETPKVADAPAALSSFGLAPSKAPGPTPLAISSKEEGATESVTAGSEEKKEEAKPLQLFGQPKASPLTSGFGSSLGAALKAPEIAASPAAPAGAAAPFGAMVPTSAAPGATDYRGQVKSIYEKYNPTKLAELDALMAKYKGREAEMIAKLRKKYGVAAEPSTALTVAAPAAATPANKVPDTPLFQGTALTPFSAPQPSFGQTSLPGATAGAGTPGATGFGAAAAGAASPFGSVTGMGATGFGSAAPKPFGMQTTPAPAPAPAQGFGGGGFGGSATPQVDHNVLHQWMMQVYQSKDPTKVAKIGSLLQKYRGNELKMVATLCNKYACPPPPGVPAGAAAAPAAAGMQFGQAAAPTPAFGGGMSGFGQTPAVQPFGQATAAAPAPASMFGAPSATGGFSAATPAFGSTTALGGFGSGFGQQQQQSQQQQSTPFGSFSGSSAATATGGGFGGLAHQTGAQTGFGSGSFTGANFSQMRS